MKNSTKEGKTVIISEVSLGTLLMGCLGAQLGTADVRRRILYHMWL